jgi:membrane-bound ClpP family serine protease
MIVIGAALLVIAVICIILGVAVQAVNFLLWVGVALIVIGAIVLVYQRVSGRNLP